MFKRKVRRSREFNKNNRLIDFEKAKEARREKREALALATKIEKRAKPSWRRISRKARKRNFYAAIMIIIVAAAGISVFNIVSANSQLAEAIAEQVNLEKEKEKLAYELDNVDSQEYVEQQARTLLKMIKPGEIYYIVPDDTE